MGIKNVLHLSEVALNRFALENFFFPCVDGDIVYFFRLAVHNDETEGFFHRSSQPLLGLKSLYP